MRRFLAVLCCAALPVFAQEPPKLEPLPEPPEMPADTADEDSNVTVTILQRGQDTIEEHRVRGRLYMVKVTPPHGVPYYLIDRTGSGQMVRQDVAPEVSVPMWVLRRW